MILYVVHGGSSRMANTRRSVTRYVNQARTWQYLRSYSSEKESSIGGPVAIPRPATKDVTLAAPAYTSIKSNLYAKGLVGDGSELTVPSKSCSSKSPKRFKNTSVGVCNLV